MSEVIMRVKLYPALLYCNLLLLLLSSCSVSVAPSLTAISPGEEGLSSQEYIIGSEDIIEV
jgi:hypothetical protein